MSKRFDQTESKQQWLAQRHKNSKSKQGSFGITLQTRPQHLPLSFAQQRLWFLEQLEPGNTAYLLPFAWRLLGPLDICPLETSLTELVARHESLRTTISLFDGQPVQIIAPKAPVLLPFHDLTSLTEVARATELQRLIHEETHQPFDLTMSPLWRGQLIRLGVEEHALLLTLHHIITDGWSMGVFFKEWMTLYKMEITGEPAKLPPLPLQYADYAIWQRQQLQGKELDRQLTYWCTQLAKAPPSLDLPTDFPRPQQQTYRGERLRFTLPWKLTQALKTLNQQEGVTLFMTMLAAFQLLLFRYTGQHDILLGTPIAGRTHTNLEGLIGFFVNTLVLRTDLKGQTTFREVLHQVREICLEAYTHQDLPFEKLVETLQTTRDVSRHPIFQVMFQLHQEEVNDGLILPNVHVESIQKTTPTSQFDLLLTLVLTQENINGSFTFNTDLFAPDTIKQLATHYQKLLESLIEDPLQVVSHIPLLTDTEQQRLIEWNETTQDYPHTKCVHQLFEEQVERSPDAIAVVFEDQQLTYRELNRRSNQLAHFLREQGVGPDVRVGLCLERGLEMIMSLLAVLKAGGAYVPLDPTYPEERLQYIVTHAQPQCILTQPELCPWLAHTEASRINLAPDWSSFAHYPPHNPFSSHSNLNLAYVIYTSGSTGKPKGVMVTHKAVTNLLLTLQEHVGIDKTATVLAVTSLSFDISVLELFGPLIVSGRLVLTRREVATDGAALRVVLQSQAITMMQATPSTWAMLIQSSPAPLPRSIKILCGGEALTPDLAHQIESWGASIWNVYGPTETTIWSTFWKLQPSNERILIGHPLANTKVFLVDQNEELVPIGLPGEMLIGGDGLARGYHCNPALTAEKFIPHPYSAEHGARLYRSGDMVKYWPDGALEFLGRRDHQVKLRGFRIECGEIETTLTAHPSVREAIVLCREDGPGDKTLVAYVIPTDNSQPNPTDLMEWLRCTLPDYMVPTVFVALKAIPLTPNGKVDRKALPAPDQTHRAKSTAYVPPRTPIEKLLTDIWRELLKINQISIHDNFFELGGHSLLAVRLFTQIEKLTGKRLPLATLFQASTVAHLANVLRQDDWAASRASLVPIQSGGSHSPFFCLHAAGGNVLLYRALAQHLGSDQPFYGVQAQGLDGPQPLFTQVEEMAAHYLKDIRTLQPQGPYFLGGLCFGGKVAFEMAQQLHAQGQQVALLALLDTAGPGYPQLLPGVSRLRYKVGGWMLRVRHHMENLQLLGPSEKIAYMVEKIGKKTGLLKTRCLDATVRRWMPRAVASTETSSLDVLHQLEATNVAAALRHAPQVYPGKIILFRASKQPPGIVPDPLMGWNSLATEGVEVYEVTGDHLSMLQEPQVRGLATQLCECLRQARTAAGSRA